MMKRILFLIGLLLSINLAKGQSPSPDNGSFIPAGVRQYQFSLPKEVKSIEQLQYVPSGEPVKGNLSPDGKRVVMDNYRKGSKVKFTIVNLDGTKEELQRTPCVIDPVTYEL